LPILQTWWRASAQATFSLALTDALAPTEEKDYYRLEPSLQDASSEMDDISDENLKNLHEAGLHYVAKNDALIEENVDKLIHYA
jgi:porphobilinogen deaminase